MLPGFYAGDCFVSLHGLDSLLVVWLTSWFYIEWMGVTPYFDYVKMVPLGFVQHVDVLTTAFYSV
jgi:hypothetical protein